MSGLYLSYEETLDVPTLHKDFSWPEGFHELDWGSVVQVQIHCLKNVFPFFAISINGKWYKAKIWHNDCLWPVNMS